MLGCIQPMSSPMMNRMLGFCSCAAAGATPATVAASAIGTAAANRRFDRAFISGLPLSLVELGLRTRQRRALSPPEIALLMAGRSLKSERDLEPDERPVKGHVPIEAVAAVAVFVLLLEHPVA